MSKGRLEAFSDGVIAIAITLLVLNIHVPSPSSGDLAGKLGDEWPSYASYATSFLTIGIIWINHHAMLARLKAVYSVLLLNLVLLMFVGLLPFTTALMAEYVRQSSGERLAAVYYAGSLLAMSLAFFSMQRQILRRRLHLLHDDIDERRREAIYRRNRAGMLPYAVATAAALISPYLTLAICAALAIFYALPKRNGRRRGATAIAARSPSPRRRGRSGGGRAAGRGDRPRTRPSAVRRGSRPSSPGAGPDAVAGSGVRRRCARAREPRARRSRWTDGWRARRSASRSRASRSTRSAAASSTVSTSPLTSTCLCNACHGNTSAARGVDGELASLARVAVAVEDEAGLVELLEQHGARRGARVGASALASTIAVGSGSCAAVACASHAAQQLEPMCGRVALVE